MSMKVYFYLVPQVLLIKLKLSERNITISIVFYKTTTEKLDSAGTNLKR